jgi:hypothetical protein
VVCLCAVLAGSPVLAAVFSGHVLDAQSDQPLPAANVSLNDSLGTACDAEGQFYLDVPPGAYQLTVSMIGYHNMLERIEVPEAGHRQQVYRLAVQVLEMEGVVVVKRRPTLPVFSEVAEAAGIHFEHTYGEGPLKNILQTTGAGACFFDADGDGDQDLYLVNGYGSEQAPEARSTNALYRNDGDGLFTDITASSGTGDRGFGMGCAAADYDGDDDVDLYVTNYGPNVLYRNESDVRFTDVGGRAGVDHPDWSVGAAWADYDLDGDLDLFVGNYLDFSLEESVARNLVSLREGFRLYPGPRDYGAQPDVLYRNDGDGIFADVSSEAGINQSLGKAMGCGFADYDDDGDPDLFVANDRTPNHLYRNDGGQFSEIGLWAGVAYNESGNESGAMAVDFGDYDNDGLLDLLVTDFIFEYNALYRNRGDGGFDDVSVRAQLALPSFGLVAWGAALFDYDNDGYLDLFVANGHVHENIDILTEGLSFEEPNQLFHNEGDGRFTDVSRKSGPHFLEPKVSRGVATADYDNDGDVDVLVVNAGHRPDLLRNDGGNDEHWLGLQLVGSGDNGGAIGARVRVLAGSLNMMREVHSGSSYLSQNDTRLFFGLGGYEQAERVHIRWPGGREQELKNVAADQMLSVVADAGMR